MLSILNLAFVPYDFASILSSNFKLFDHCIKPNIYIWYAAFLVAATSIEIMRHANIGVGKGGSPVWNEKITFRVEYPNKETNTNLF